LDSQQPTFEALLDELITDVINRGSMTRENRDKLKSILLSQHRDHLTVSGAMARKMSQLPLADLFSSDGKRSNLISNQSIDQFGSIMSRRKSSFFQNNRGGSFLPKSFLSDSFTSSEQNFEVPGDLNIFAFY
jgi:hypothetical protein